MPATKPLSSAPINRIGACHVFAWTYLKLKKQLPVEREAAHAIYQLGQLTRCMPGAVAHVGEPVPALLQLLEAAVGSGREILILDESAAPEQPPRSAMLPLSSLPGLAPVSQPGGLRTVPGPLQQAAQHLGAEQRFCFVHCMPTSARQLSDTLALCLERLSPGALLLISLPDAADPYRAATILDATLQGRNQQWVQLPNAQCLVLSPPPSRPADHRQRDRVRVREVREPYVRAPAAIP